MTRFISGADDRPAEVSVVVVTHNNASDIGALLTSLREQAARTALRVTIVDNASSDSTLDIVSGQTDVRVLSTGTNLGYAGGINAAMREIPAEEHLLVLNPDLRVEEGAVRALLDRLEHTGAGVVLPRILDAEGELVHSLRREPTITRAMGDALLGSRLASRPGRLSDVIGDRRAYSTAHPVDWGSGAALLVDRDVARLVGEWDERFFLYSEEIDFQHRVRSLGREIWYEPEAIVMHRQGGSGASEELVALMEVNRIRYFSKYHRGARVAAYRGAVVLHQLMRMWQPDRRHALGAVVDAGSWRTLPRAGRTGPAQQGSAGTVRRVHGAESRAPEGSRDRHVLVIVQNLPVPFDRRVWLECQALRANGFEVSVICPKGPGDPGRQEIDGVRIHKYRPAPGASGLAGFALEFAYSWLRTAALSLTVARERPFGIIQACNPPDTYWLLALLWRVRGVRFVFDHHDLNPELFISRFGSPSSAVQRMEFSVLSWLEQMTFRSAHRVISTNHSYRRIALRRGKVHPWAATVVRSGPDTRTMRPRYPSAPRRADITELVYLGIMGPQDGVENVLHVMDELVHNRGRTDVHATLMGFGDSLEDLRRLARELNLDEWVTFTGRADRQMVAENLSRADIGLCPDLKTPLNNLSTMNKTMEYMAFALPSVSFDLTETLVSGGDNILVAPSGDIAAFTDAVERLVIDKELRLSLGRSARARVAETLDWKAQAAAYIGVYDSLLGIERPDGFRYPDLPSQTHDEWGQEFVPLDDEDELNRFILERR